MPAAKFHSSSSEIDNTGQLTVTWDQRGLGEEDITYTLTADAKATWACINKGGQHPEAANKEDKQDTVSESETFTPENGRVEGEMTADCPQAGDFSCPPGQDLELAAVSFTNIVLTDEANGVSENIEDASVTLIEGI